LWQTHYIRGRLSELFPDWEFPVEIIKTSGDRIQDRALYRVEDKGFFTKEIEEALGGGRIDVAVHSLKDLPVESPPGLLVAAIPPREDPRDLWIARGGFGWMEAPRGCRVGTSSLRRRAQLLALRPDLTFVELRGNVPTRLRRLEEGAYDAVVLARAGLHRLDLIPEGARTIEPEQLLPAPGQGALAVQVRRDDSEARACLARLDDPETRATVTAERALLKHLQGGCLVPVGALARFRENRLQLSGMVADLSGRPIFRGEESTAGGTVSGDDATRLGERLAQRLLDEGAGPVLDSVREFLRKSQTGKGSGPGPIPASEAPLEGSEA